MKNFETALSVVGENSGGWVVWIYYNDHTGYIYFLREDRWGVVGIMVSEIRFVVLDFEPLDREVVRFGQQL